MTCKYNCCYKNCSCAILFFYHSAGTQWHWISQLAQTIDPSFQLKKALTQRFAQKSVWQNTWCWNMRLTRHQPQTIGTKPICSSKGVGGKYFLKSKLITIKISSLFIILVLFINLVIEPTIFNNAKLCRLVLNVTLMVMLQNRRWIDGRLFLLSRKIHLWRQLLYDKFDK